MLQRKNETESDLGAQTAHMTLLKSSLLDGQKLAPFHLLIAAEETAVRETNPEEIQKLSHLLQILGWPLFFNSGYFFNEQGFKDQQNKSHILILAPSLNYTPGLNELVCNLCNISVSEEVKGKE